MTHCPQAKFLTQYPHHSGSGCSAEFRNCEWVRLKTNNCSAGIFEVIVSFSALQQPCISRRLSSVHPGPNCKERRKVCGQPAIWEVKRDAKCFHSLAILWLFLLLSVFGLCLNAGYLCWMILRCILHTVFITNILKTETKSGRDSPHNHSARLVVWTHQCIPHVSCLSVGVDMYVCGVLWRIW